MNRFNTTLPITEILINTFGVTFCRATLEQRLALIEVVGFLMREQHQNLGYALLIIVPSVVMPENLLEAHIRLQSLREGLTLLALLYGSVNKEVPPFLLED